MVDEVCVSNAHSVGVGNDERRYCDCDVSSRKLMRVRKIKNHSTILLLARGKEIVPHKNPQFLRPYCVGGKRKIYVGINM